MFHRRYPLDLSTAMAVCDANYIRILKLLPELTLHLTREIVLPAVGSYENADSGSLVVLTVEERFRYTSTVSIRLVHTGAGSCYYQPPEILVRLYHDASTAEVVSYQEQGAFHLRSQQGDFPEFTPDEKQQVNAFLAEWLMLCMEHGLGHRIAGEGAGTEPLIPSV